MQNLMKPEALSQEFSGIVAASSDRGQCIESFYLKICIHCKTQHHPSSTRSASVLLNDQEVDDTDLSELWSSFVSHF